MARMVMAIPHFTDPALSGEALEGSGFENETPDPDYAQEDSQ